VRRRFDVLHHRYYEEVRGIHLKERDRSYEHSFKGAWGKWRYQQALKAGVRKKLAMFKFYSEVARRPALDVPYVYVALHFQPERTTSSLGGVFGHQYFMVDMLARTVPQGWYVYVKEHPSQFYPPFAGERSRHPDMYRELLSIPNVRLCDLSMSTFELLDRSRAVATVTGTVGWEAVVRGKPALVFGSPWYRYCDGVFHTTTIIELEHALAAIQAGARPDPAKVRLFVQVLDQLCARAGFGYGTPDEAGVQISFDESVDRLTAALERTWLHMHRSTDMSAAALVEAGVATARTPQPVL
jgi:hypothetical protein